MNVGVRTVLYAIHEMEQHENNNKYPNFAVEPQNFRLGL